MDEILKRFNLTMDDLTAGERDTLFSWMEALQQNKLTLQKVKDYISQMKAMLIDSLADEPEFISVFIFKLPNRKQILMKARLRNYVLLESFLESPERAKNAIEKALGNIKSAKVNK